MDDPEDKKSDSIKYFFLLLSGRLLSGRLVHVQLLVVLARRLRRGQRRNPGVDVTGMSFMFKQISKKSNVILKLASILFISI